MGDVQRYKCNVIGYLQTIVLQASPDGDYVKAKDYDSVAIQLTAALVDRATLCEQVTNLRAELSEATSSLEQQKLSTRAHQLEAADLRRKLEQAKELLDKYPIDGFHRPAIEALIRTTS